MRFIRFPVLIFHPLLYRVQRNCVEVVVLVYRAFFVRGICDTILLTFMLFMWNRGWPRVIGDVWFPVMISLLFQPLLIRWHILIHFVTYWLYCFSCSTIYSFIICFLFSNIDFYLRHPPLVDTDRCSWQSGSYCFTPRLPATESPPRLPTVTTTCESEPRRCARPSPVGHRHRVRQCRHRHSASITTFAWRE